MNTEKSYLEDFKVGEKTVSLGRTVTEADIVMFASLSGDWNELHTNAEYMKNSVFGQRIAHGMLTLSIASGLVMRMRGRLPVEVLAFLGMDRLDSWRQFSSVTLSELSQRSSKQGQVRACLAQGY